MADYARLAADAGARIVGGCCGTSARHLAAMRKALDEHAAAPRPTLADIVEKIGPLASPPADNTNREPRRTSRRRA
jgi:5-methyltetrahydrofolate--homocysteine methyltransferase